MGKWKELHAEAEATRRRAETAKAEEAKAEAAEAAKADAGKADAAPAKADAAPAPAKTAAKAVDLDELFEALEKMESSHDADYSAAEIEAEAERLRVKAEEAIEAAAERYRSLQAKAEAAKAAEAARLRQADEEINSAMVELRRFTGPGTIRDGDAMVAVWIEDGAIHHFLSFKEVMEL